MQHQQSSSNSDAFSPSLSTFFFDFPFRCFPSIDDEKKMNSSRFPSTGMSQLNAGDVLAIVGGDVSRKPVLQCIGKRGERERGKRREEGRKREREKAFERILKSREALAFSLFTRVLLLLLLLLLAPASLASMLRSPSALAALSYPQPQKREGECGVDKEQEKREKRRRRRELLEPFSFLFCSRPLLSLCLRVDSLSACEGEDSRAHVPREKVEDGRGEAAREGASKGDLASLALLSLHGRRRRRAAKEHASHVAPLTSLSQLKKKTLPLSLASSPPPKKLTNKQASSRWPPPPRPAERARPPRPSATASASLTGSTGERERERKSWS